LEWVDLVSDKAGNGHGHSRRDWRHAGKGYGAGSEPAEERAARSRSLGEE